MSKSNFGFPAALAAIAGIFTIGGLGSIGMLRKAVGTILIMLVGIYAVSNIKGDFFDMIKDFSTRSEAADIRRLEFERERLKLEAETKLKVLEIETKRTDAERRAKEVERVRQEKQAAAEKARQESERIRQEKLAEDTAKKEVEDRAVKAKQTALSGGFKLFEKNNFREIHYKLLQTKWDNQGHKIISSEIVLSRNELTTATSGMKWQSERHVIEINCVYQISRVSEAAVHNGPWNTGDVLYSSARGTEWKEFRDWHKGFADKFCEAGTF